MEKSQKNYAFIDSQNLNLSIRRLGWKMEKLLVPDQGKYSALLKRFPSEYLAFVSDLRKKLEYAGRPQK